MTKICAGTGKPLVPGSHCFSVLVERDGAQERLDFSSEGWQGVPEGTVGHWKSTVPDQEATVATVTDPEELMRYFELLAESPNPAQERLCYVLALSLLQKRRLRLDGTQVMNDVVCLELAGSRGEGPYFIRDQRLAESEIAELRRAVDAQILLGGEAA